MTITRYVKKNCVPECLAWVTPTWDQGQMCEVSFSVDEEGLGEWKRIVDKSSRTVTYYRREDLEG